MNAAVDADDGDLELRRLSLKALREWKGRLRQIIEDGMEQGEVRKNVDPCSIANTMIAVLEGSVLISRLERSRQSLDDAALHLHGLIDGLAVA
jgi:TetR/AcrR family transcriptional regulator, transcriptional repressor for nem operon